MRKRRCAGKRAAWESLIQVSQFGLSQKEFCSRNTEVFLAEINIRRKHSDFHLPAVTDVTHYFVRIVDRTIEQRGHKLHRVMGLEVSSLVGDQTVSDGMGFIETIACEIIDQVEDVVGLVFRGLDSTAFDKYRIIQTTPDEPVALLRHFLWDFFPDRTAQQVRMSKGETGQHLNGLHDLLLVNHYPVRFFEDRLEQWMRINHLLASVFALDKVLDHAGSQGTWTIECKDGDDILKA